MANLNGNGAMDIITANQFKRAMNQMVENAWTRTYLARELQGADPRKDIDDECGYPHGAPNAEETETQKEDE